MSSSFNCFAASCVLSASLIACATAQAGQASPDCHSERTIGLFDPSRDLLLANYDSKPDVDDLQAVAGFGSVLRHPA